ncbi:MAG: helix-turn-helix transcriptional regulator [Faecalibacterium sp.]
MIISDKLLYLRKKQNYTQEELAELLHVSRQSISKWESGQSIPDITKIMSMAELFSVSTDYLLRDEIETLEGEVPAIDLAAKGEVVTIEEAHAFLSAHALQSKCIAKGAFLCILSPTILFALLALWGETPQETLAVALGLCALFCFVAPAAGMFIYGESLVKRYAYILESDFELSFNVHGILKEEAERYHPQYTKNLVISICLFIFAPLPLVVVALMLESTSAVLSMLVLLLAVVAVGAFRVIIGENKKECYALLLSAQSSAKKKKNKVKDVVESVYWSVLLAGYLGWSFMTNDWHITWVVWPIGALLSVALDLLWVKDLEDDGSK